MTTLRTKLLNEADKAAGEAAALGFGIERDENGIARIASLPGEGHNRIHTAADDRLRLLIERIERLEEEKHGISDDIRDVYGEARATGYDAKILRQIVRLRKMKPDDRREMEAILETYKCAVGLD